MNEPEKIYEDDRGHVHTLTEQLGEAGAQGIVYRTRDADVAVKFALENEKEITAEKEIAKYHEKFLGVRLLPIPKETNITLPITILKKQAGYVMQLLSDMVPVDLILIHINKARETIKNEEIPDWLKEMPNIDAAKEFVLYRDTGALRRRLLSLYTIASQLALLHGAGLVYCDISERNIFVSKEADSGNAWFIDSDNLEFAGNTVGFYSDGFGAPEVVQEKSNCTMYSDCHAFAAMAYQILTMAHPFLGKKGDRDHALAGYYPWVHDEDDDSNSSRKGIPPQDLFDDEIANLFQKTFGKGRLDPSRRPSIFHWPFAFARAADATIQCPVCKMSYRYDYRGADGREQCPYCGASKPPLLIMEAYSWNGALGERQWLFAREIESETPVEVPARVFALTPLTRSDMTALEIKIKGNKLYIKKAYDAEIDFSVAVTGLKQGKFEKLSSQSRIQTTAENILSQEVRFFIFAESDNCSRMVKCGIGQKQK